ncbi:MAG: hypothetical protein JW891_03260 [Candidatus Lokiarchaeota archaeon]|nr:hypothetical protein [Candidatus Lokiarchaeota archaeon]
MLKYEYNTKMTTRTIETIDTKVVESIIISTKNIPDTDPIDHVEITENTNAIINWNTKPPVSSRDWSHCLFFFIIRKASKTNAVGKITRNRDAPVMILTIYANSKVIVV